MNDIIIKLYETGVLGIQLSNEHEHWYYRRYMKVTGFRLNSRADHDIIRAINLVGVICK